MKTAHDTLTTWNDGVMAAGFDSSLCESRQAAIVRRPEEKARVRAEDKVIDLNQWRAANLEELRDWDCGEAAWAEELPAVPAPRPRKSRRAMVIAELVSTLSVVAVAVAIIVRVLTF